MYIAPPKKNDGKGEGPKQMELQGSWASRRFAGITEGTLRPRATRAASITMRQLWPRSSPR